MNNEERAMMAATAVVRCSLFVLLSSFSILHSPFNKKTPAGSCEPAGELFKIGLHHSQESGVRTRLLSLVRAKA
jgi:hypothetical protein